MKRSLSRLILVVGILFGFAFHWACAPQLDEQQVRARLVDQLQLQNEPLHVRSISRGALPIASIDYGGAPASIRFRRQADVWVIDAVQQAGRWETADRAVPRLARELTEKAQALRVADIMPRYARTLKLLVGWSELLSTGAASGLPGSETALLNLHATWHRRLFVNRGSEFHNADLFLRDAWWKPLRVRFAATAVDVQSSGEDRRMDTPDDMRLVYACSRVRAGVTVCEPHFTIPRSAGESLGRQDAPAAWNCADLMQMLKRSEHLELVADRR